MKIPLPRPQGAVGKIDMYAAQQHVSLQPSPFFVSPGSSLSQPALKSTCFHRYEFSNVRPGLYCVFARYQDASNVMYWMVP